MSKRLRVFWWSVRFYGVRFSLRHFSQFVDDYLIKGIEPVGWGGPITHTRWQEHVRDAWQPPDDWFSRIYKRFYAYSLITDIAAWACHRGFLYKTSRCGFLVTYRWQWRFWRGAYWKFQNLTQSPCECGAKPKEYHERLCEHFRAVWR